MHSLVPIIGIVFGCLTPIIIVWMLITLPSRKKDSLEKNETLLMQEMYKSLNKLEDRIEALETILLEHERRQRNRK